MIIPKLKSFIPFVVLMLVLFPVVIYWIKFGTFHLAEDFTEWVDFSTFWSPYLMAALTVVLAYLSWQSLNLMKMKEKPFLVVEKRAPNGNGDEFHFVRNIGSGPALDLKLFIKVENYEYIHNDPFLISSGITSVLDEVGSRSGFHYMVCSFSLSPNESFFIDWQKNIEMFIIIYSDIYERKTSLLWKNDGFKIEEGDNMKIDNNGFRGNDMIFIKDASSSRKYNQVFSLADVGNKEQKM